MSTNNNGTNTEETADATVLLREREAGRRPSIPSLFVLALLFYFFTSGDSSSDESGIRERATAVGWTLGWKSATANWLTQQELNHTNVYNVSGQQVNYSIPVFEPQVLQLPKLPSLLHPLSNSYPINITGFTRGYWTVPDSSSDTVATNSTNSTGSTNELYEFLTSSGIKQGKVTFEWREDKKSLVGPLERPVSTQQLLQDEGTLDVEAFESQEWEIKDSEIYQTIAKDTWGKRENMSRHLSEWETVGVSGLLKGDVTFYTTDDRSLNLDVEAVHFHQYGLIVGYALSSLEQIENDLKMFSVPNATEQNNTSFIDTHLKEYPLLNIVDLVYTISDQMGLNATHTSLAAGWTVWRELSQRVVRLETNKPSNSNANDDTDLQPDWAEADPKADKDKAKCGYHLIGVLDPLPEPYLTKSQLYREYYSELWKPTGSSLPALDRMAHLGGQIMLIPLAGCTNNSQIVPTTVEVLPAVRMGTRVGNFCTILMVTHIILLYLLLKQLNRTASSSVTASPSSSNPVSHFTPTLHSVPDIYVALIAATFALIVGDRMKTGLMGVAFLSGMSGVVTGRWAAAIRRVQENSSGWRGLNPTTPTPTTQPSPTENDAAPTQQTTTSRIGLSGEVKFAIISAIVITSIIAFVTIWSWISLVIVLLYSYWIPQIVHNVKRGSARQSLTRSYIIGTTLGRLVLPVYFYGCPYNVFDIETSDWIRILVIYSLIQMSILLSQDTRLGARWFIPACFLKDLGINDEHAWDYHPLLDNDEESSRWAEGDSVECPICLEPVKIRSTTGHTRKPSIEKKSLEEEQSGRWGYMVPPCHHICHTSCLEGWLRYKHVCPVCRGPLPAL